MVTVWLWADVPASVKERLGLGHVDRDEGFDLVAEQADGRLWAVQCKFRGSSDRPVVRADFDSTFALAATCRQLAGVILSHTSARPFQKLGLVAGARSVVELQLDTWATLSEEAWAAIRGWVSGEPITLTPRVPRPHQQAAIDAAVRHYVEAGSPRGRMVMPCGAGKSLTAFWIADALDARTVIVAVPSLALIRQTLLEWTRELSAIQEEASWLCVCSDESVVGGRSREDVEQDSFATSPAAAGIQATTNPDVIAGFLASSSGSRRILFTTYHSAPGTGRSHRAAGSGR